MSHVTDGELHLVLDGALELLPGERPREVREHLAVCGDCARRLEEERRLRDRSRELLRHADPDEASPPPFGELRARAGGGEGGGSPAPDGPSGGTPWLRGLAWAASVVLALGVGWYAGGDAGAVPEPGADAAEEAQVATADRRASAESGARGEPGPTEPGAAAREEPVAVPGGSHAAPAGTTPATAVEGSLAVPGLPVLAVAWEGEDSGDGRALRVLQGLPGGDTLVLHYTSAAAEGVAPSSAERAPDQAPVSPVPAARGRTPAGEARARAPEAESLREAPAPAADRAEEDALEDAPGAGADTGTGAPGVRVRRGAWILEARAALPADSLRSLVERLPPPE